MTILSMKLSIESKHWQRKNKYPWPRLRLLGFSARMVRISLISLILAITAPIVGLNSEARIKETVEAINIQLTEEEIKHLEEPYAPKKTVVGFA